MEIQGSQLKLRPWRRTDEDALVRCANDKRVWRNMLATFPHPYTPADAQDWFDRCERFETDRVFAIEVDTFDLGRCSL